MNTKDSELLVTGLREIPFRLMARENNIGENMFIERMQRIECPYRFFLQNNCEFHFTAIGNILTAFQTDRIRRIIIHKLIVKLYLLNVILIPITDRTNENDKKKNKLQLGAIEETSPSSLKSYSDVLVSSARKEYQTTDFLINLNVKFNPVMNRRMAPVLTEQQIRDKWSNKIITGLSEEFKAYQEIEECDLDFKLLHSAFGIYHRSLVDIFLEDFRRVK